MNEDSTDVIYDMTVLHNNNEEETNSEDDSSSDNASLEDDGLYSDDTNLEDKGANDIKIKIENDETLTMENIKVETVTEEEDENNDVKYDDNDRPIRSNWGKRDFLDMTTDGKSYGNRVNNCMIEKACRVMFTQMQAKKGIEKIGERAIAALVKEFKQLNDGAVPGKPVVCPVNPNTLTKEDKCKEFNAVTIIKEKRNGDVKGRACADGSRQKYEFGKNVSSPTVSLEALFTTLIIDAIELRDIDTFYVPGAFLQPELPEGSGMVLLKLRGIFVDIICEVKEE